jgi:phage-related protein
MGNGCRILTEYFLPVLGELTDKASLFNALFVLFLDIRTNKIYSANRWRYLMFRIKVYFDRSGDSPIKEFLNDLDKKAQTDKSSRIRLKVISRFMNLLRQYGTRIGFPTVRYIEDDIWELRPNDDRIFFAYWKDNVFLLLHHFEKETQKTPSREIDQAKRNLKDFLERSEEK